MEAPTQGVGLRRRRGVGRIVFAAQVVLGGAASASALLQGAFLSTSAPVSPRFQHADALRARRGLVWKHELCSLSTSSSSPSFRTEVDVNKMPFQVKLDDRLFLMGSCFSENVGARLKGLKMNVEINPFGISYNPLSLAWNLERLLEDAPFEMSDVTVGQSNRYFSYQHHSSFTRSEAAATLNAMNAAWKRGRESLLESKVVFLTLGSAWSWRLKESGSLVANCHKQPSRLFEKVLVSPLEVETALRAAVEKCAAVNPDVQVVLTVSPVRHWRDGASESARSKAILLVAAHELCQKDPSRFCYFPSYEIMMDDLRDYRFYEADMLHPSHQAVDYIWNKLQDAMLCPSCVPTIAKLDSLSRAAQHRAFDAASDEHQAFLRRQLQLVDSLSLAFPHMDLAPERAHFLSLLDRGPN